jgi:hypothetical protein
VRGGETDPVRGAAKATPAQSWQSDGMANRDDPIFGTFSPAATF